VNTILTPHLRTCSSSEDFKQRLLSLKMTEIIIINGLCPTSCPSIEAEISSSGRDDERISDSVRVMLLVFLKAKGRFGLFLAL